MTNTLIALALVVLARQQPPPMNLEPPKEMKGCSFLVGEWKGTFKSSFSGTSSEAPTTMRARMGLNGRFLIADHTYSIGPGQPMMQGMFMMTYDSAAKVWRSWWFDGMEAQVMEMEGTIEGNKMVMTSKPITMSSMPEPMVMRETMTKKDDNTLMFVLEMKNKDKWDVLMDGTLKKVK